MSPSGLGPAPSAPPPRPAPALAFPTAVWALPVVMQTHSCLCTHLAAAATSRGLRRSVLFSVLVTGEPRAVQPQMKASVCGAFPGPSQPRLPIRTLPWMPRRPDTCAPTVGASCWPVQLLGGSAQLVRRPVPREWREPGPAPHFPLELHSVPPLTLDPSSSTGVRTVRTMWPLEFLF